MKKYFRWPVFLIFAAFIVATLIPAIPLLHQGKTPARAAGPANSSGPSLSTSANNVRIGQSITVTGQGFAPGESVNLALDASSVNNLGSIPCDNTGTCTAVVTLTIYNSFVEGSYPLVGTGSTSGAMAQVALHFEPQITLGVPQPGARPKVGSGGGGGNANPVKVGPGSTINVLGITFAANETVQVYLGTTTGTLEGTATTDANGTFYFDFNTPTTLTPGTYFVTAARTNQKPATVTAQFHIIPPQMSVTPNLQSGYPVRIVLKGFQASEQVTISWNANGGQVLGTVFTDPTGAVISCPTGHEVSCIVPPSVPHGTYTLTAMGNTSGLQATISMNVVPGITLNPTLAGPGSTITVIGGGFTPGETVKVYFQTTTNGIVKTSVNTSGAFSVSLTVPTTYQQGIIYYVHASNNGGTEHAKAQFYFGIPFISINNDSNTATFGSPTSIYGTNFQANETVNLYWNYQQTGQVLAGTVKADQYGTINGSVKTPSDPDLGNVNIAAIGATSGIKATTTIYEYGALILTPTQGQPGTTVHAVAGGFGSKETVTVTFSDPGQGTTTVATVTSDVRGGVKTAFLVPANALANVVQVDAMGGTTNIQFSAQFQVQ